MGKCLLLVAVVFHWRSVLTPQPPRRAVSFIPRTVRELITSTVSPDGKLSVSARRQLKQQQERRQAATVTYVDQRADDLKEIKDESVDVVISLTAAAKMIENGLDWKKGVQEAARVLKPGGRFLFVEPTELEGEAYLDFLENLLDTTKEAEEDQFPVFDDGGWDPVDMVLVPHVAGVAFKSIDAGMTALERSQKESTEKKDEMAELSIKAFERGRKKRRKKKKMTDTDKDGFE
jgi:ubiquinone/menaquinone biosynthesis C-methylase UbiE